MHNHKGNEQKCQALFHSNVYKAMPSQNKPESPSKIPLSEPHQWLEQAIEENHIKYFDYSCFKNFEYLGTGGFGKVEKAIYNFAGAKIPCALKSIFNLKDVHMEKKALKQFIKEASIYFIYYYRYFPNSYIN